MSAARSALLHAGFRNPNLAAATLASGESGRVVAEVTTYYLSCEHHDLSYQTANAARDAYMNTLAPLLQEIFGNSFQPVSVPRTWLSWENGSIPKLAQAIYADRTFECLPILADALEEAGCTDAAMLGHCREPGEHVRGCWVVDLLLGKE
jgi:hypothetical protein